MDVHTISAKSTNVHGGHVDMEQCQSEKNGRTRRQYPQHLVETAEGIA